MEVNKTADEDDAGQNVSQGQAADKEVGRLFPGPRGGEDQVQHQRVLENAQCPKEAAQCGNAYLLRLRAEDHEAFHGVHTAFGGVFMCLTNIHCN